MVRPTEGLGNIADQNDLDTVSSRRLEAVSSDYAVPHRHTRHQADGEILISAYLTSRRKRFFDLALAVPAAVLLTPIILFLAVLSAAAHHAWPFFVQERVGRNGTLFQFVKVRSLPPSAPKSADKYSLGLVSITRTGRFLRGSHLDELPQLWLVVKGAMSLVGPRPEMPELSKTFDPGFVHARTRALPGCTGLWQVSIAAGQLIGESPEFDLYYLKHASIRFDLWLLIRTIAESTHQASALSLPQVPTWVRKHRGHRTSVPPDRVQVEDRPITRPA